MTAQADRAWSLRHLGRHEDALGAARLALTLDPDDLHATGCLALSYSALDRDGEAMAAARRLVGAHPQVPWAFWIASMTAHDANQLPTAQAWAEAGLRQDPTDVRLLAIAAQVASRQRRSWDASMLAGQAIAAAPADASVWRAAAAVAANNGNSPAAEHALRKVLELQPDDPHALAQLSRVLRAQHRDKEADEVGAGAVLAAPADVRLASSMRTNPLPRWWPSVVVPVGLVVYVGTVRGGDALAGPFLTLGALVFWGVVQVLQDVRQRGRPAVMAAVDRDGRDRQSRDLAAVLLVLAVGGVIGWLAEAAHHGPGFLAGAAAGLGTAALLASRVARTGHREPAEPDSLPRAAHGKAVAWTNGPVAALLLLSLLPQTTVVDALSWLPVAAFLAGVARAVLALATDTGQELVSLRTGRAARPGQHAVRWLVETTTLLCFGVGFWATAKDPQRRSVADRVTGCRLVARPRKGGLPRKRRRWVALFI